MYDHRRWCNATNYASFASAAPTKLLSSIPRRPSTATASSSCDANDGSKSSLRNIFSWSSHQNDPSLWLYHVDTTTSTMDEARRIIAGKFDNNDEATPTSFLVSATSQSAGWGTSKRIWQSSGRGNALFTIGVRQFSWMDGLKSKNDGRAVPLTLLPLKVGSLVATHIQVALRECVPRTNDDDGDNDGDGARMPMVSVKWPNDVLVRNSSSVPHEKIAGILVETTGECVSRSSQE